MTSVAAVVALWGFRSDMAWNSAAWAQIQEQRGTDRPRVVLLNPISRPCTLDMAIQCSGDFCLLSQKSYYYFAEE